MNKTKMSKLTLSAITVLNRDSGLTRASLIHRRPLYRILSLLMLLLPVVVMSPRIDKPAIWSDALWTLI